MFRLNRPDSKLQRAIDQAVRELNEHRVNSEEYAMILDRVLKLHKMQVEQKPASVSPDTLAMIAANLIGIVLIIKHEQFNNITSKALSFVPRLR